MGNPTDLPPCPAWCRLRRLNEPHPFRDGLRVHNADMGQAERNQSVTVETGLMQEETRQGLTPPYVRVFYGYDDSDHSRHVDMPTETAAALGWILTILTPRQAREFAVHMTTAAAMGMGGGE